MRVVKEAVGWMDGVEVDEFNIALRVVVMVSGPSFPRAYLNPLIRSTGQGMLAGSEQQTAATLRW
jgi:hypothetical protein